MNDTRLSRRALIGGATAAGLGGSLLAEGSSGRTAAGAGLSGTPEAPVIIPSPPEPEGILSKEAVELWPAGRVPGPLAPVSRQLLERGSPASHDRAVIRVSRPTLEVFRPERPNGAAMVILPGGAYTRLAIDKEGAGGARRMSRAGITCFVLNYRLPMDGWTVGYDVALQDAQRAIRLLRATPTAWGIDPQRIGIMGFSAGGHLAAASLTRYDSPVYQPVDAADRLSARPDVAMLGYAVMAPKPSSRLKVAAEAARPLDQRVRPGMAPTFILHAADDPAVPVSNSLAMFQALKAADVPVELHIYQQGGHGFGFSLPADLPASHWPDVFEAWLRRSRFI